MMWAVFYFVVGTHVYVPAFTTGPMSRIEAEGVASQSHLGLYSVVSPVGLDFTPRRK